MSSALILEVKLIALFNFLLFFLFVSDSHGQQTNLKMNYEKTLTDSTAQNDFDSHIGTWKTTLKRLKNPLSGSNSWIEYKGTTVVKNIYNGRANIVELDVKNNSSHIEGVSLRMYNPETKMWSLNFASLRNGTMTTASIGAFKNGVGEFYNEDEFDGKKIIVRFVITQTSSNALHFEQAFSDDDGKTWEINWIADDTRIKNKNQKEK